MSLTPIELPALVVAYVYAASAFLIGTYQIFQLHLLARSLLRTDPPLQTGASDFPFVTVQLPIYNERTVVIGLLDSVAALDWPKDRLEIQLLDDSTDETVALAAEKVAELKSRGIDVEHIRRSKREGFKAGALAYGLETARGEYIAILDADFRPRPDFLKQAMGILERNPAWGLVQGRWGHLNRSATLFTSALAFHLDVHFSVEQAARSCPPLFMGFNGTAGIWRRKAIDDAGGWSADTLTEDIDLAFRAQLAGWPLGYVDGLEVPSELPEDAPAVRSQQRRWIKGGAQVGRKLSGLLWRSDQPLLTKLHGLVHLHSGSLFLCVLGLALVNPLVGPLTTAVPWLAGALLPSQVALQVFIVGMLAIYGTMCLKREPSFGAAVRRLILTFPTFISLSCGLAIQNSLAVAEGWVGRKTPFVRTPKRGEGTGGNYKAEWAGPIVYLEATLAIWLTVGFLGAALYGHLGLAVFILLQASGFAFIVANSLPRLGGASRPPLRKEGSPQGLASP